MKTAQDFIKELGSSAELQNAVKAIKDESGLAEFLKKNDVSATVEEFAKALKAAKTGGAEGEITDDAAEAVAGGAWYDFVLRWLPWT
ncbi:MAG: hypothetical protein IJT87_10870 [Ruminiclostridium sp.]|nr:hypothetical protein [Ruminiclostridium sp.]